MSGTCTGFFDSLISAAWDNPLSAALIGGGALWLLVGDEKMRGGRAFGGYDGIRCRRQRYLQSACGRVGSSADCGASDGA